MAKTYLVTPFHEKPKARAHSRRAVRKPEQASLFVDKTRSPSKGSEPMPTTDELRPENLYDHLERVLIDSDTLRNRIADMGAQITTDFAGRPLTVVTILQGGAVFMADLVQNPQVGQDPIGEQQPHLRQITFFHPPRQRPRGRLLAMTGIGQQIALEP